MRANEREHRREGIGVANPVPAVHGGVEGGAVFGGETHREAPTGGSLAASSGGSCRAVRGVGMWPFSPLEVSSASV